MKIYLHSDYLWIRTKLSGTRRTLNTVLKRCTVCQNQRLHLLRTRYRKPRNVPNITKPEIPKSPQKTEGETMQNCLLKNDTNEKQHTHTEGHEHVSNICAKQNVLHCPDCLFFDSFVFYSPGIRNSTKMMPPSLLFDSRKSKNNTGLNDTPKTYMPILKHISVLNSTWPAPLCPDQQIAKWGAGGAPPKMYLFTVTLWVPVTFRWPVGDFP